MTQDCACCGAPVEDPTGPQREMLESVCYAKSDVMFLYSANHDGAVNLTASGQPGSVLIMPDGRLVLGGLTPNQNEWPDWMPTHLTAS